ncbi:hypothetical protein NE237_027430 [Protea cynaroides]|uniref:Uncharacterized protein n=1 Tax=Protea cynaroides TaxID=273540 RepID=A0A9Q0JUD5_9MAGN|nr:hypothetical protein NE237_027430 [Protea cynaroides]
MAWAADRGIWGYGLGGMVWRRTEGGRWLTPEDAAAAGRLAQEDAAAIGRLAREDAAATGGWLEKMRQQLGGWLEKMWQRLGGITIIKDPWWQVLDVIGQCQGIAASRKLGAWILAETNLLSVGPLAVDNEWSYGLSPVECRIQAHINKGVKI